MLDSVKVVARFLFLLLIKLASICFFRYEINWLNPPEERHFKGIRLAVLLNHTSLYEPLFLRILPLSGLWRVAKHGVFPGADKTMNRPLVGRFFKMLAKKGMTITRKRDASWHGFRASIEDESLVILAPEGRMKRANGLDLNGRRMTVRGGVADVLTHLDGGRMLLLYSQGLHHIQVPGQFLPKPFKTVGAVLEAIDINAYKQGLSFEDEQAFTQKVVADLEARRDTYCPA